METTYNNIVDKFTEFANSHGMINTVYSSFKLWSVQSHNNIYPCVALNPSTAIIKDGLVSLKVEIFILDKQKSDDSDISEIYSDTLQIATHIDGFFKNTPFEVTDGTYKNTVQICTSDTALDSIGHRLTDDVTGWLMTLQIDIPYGSSACDYPKK